MSLKQRILYENSGQLQRVGAPVYCCQIQGKRCQAQAAQSELRSQAKMATDSRVGEWGHVAEHHQRVPCPRQTGSWPSISSFDSDWAHACQLVQKIHHVSICYFFLCWFFYQVRVELSLAEGKDRGPAIVEAARKQGVSLLVVGQKKRSVTWRLLSMWMASVKGAAGGSGGGGASAADYCVQHAACMALAVRRKSRRGGGYLITTRRQRDFWLLA